MVRLFRKVARPWAIAFVLLTFANTLFPTVSYALTSGPTAPEATSFEPVDTTDMVNLATGDFTYNIPLLEVPGPAGGYPLSLSYHAGIQPNEDASWVGLGWTLNPGAINRNVNGFADDYLNVLNTDRFFWAGGERHTLEVGVTAGIAGIAGVSANLSFSQDTYQGFGVGASVGVQAGPKKSPISINATIGVDGYGNPYASTGIGLGLKSSEKSAISLGVGAGIQTNFNAVEGYSSAGINVAGESLLRATLSSGGQGSSTSVTVGGTSVNNNKSDKVSSSSYSITPPLPLINLSYSYTRYWIDETENVDVTGVLYNPSLTPVPTNFDNKAFDSYSLLNPDVNIVDNPDPDKVLGGSFLSFDNYSVNAQGLGGNMRPYSYKNIALRQNRKKSTSGYDVKQYPYPQGGFVANPLQFRFIGDFSNKYIRNGAEFQDVNGSLYPEFGSKLTGENGGDGVSANHLYGSRHIEWYTNEQILGVDASKNPKQDGFIEGKATGFVRANTGSKAKQIGGFKITNESGVTYHFALPAYSYKEYQRSENIIAKDGKTFSELTKVEPYAYTWFLTAVTGPDFVDRGVNGSADGILNEYDWGYWVEFEYGKWTDFYVWRNPSQGMTPDLDNNFQNFSEGLKEVYYLDAIRTKTHTALFAKSIRHDAKSTLYSLRHKVGFVDAPSNVISEITREGGFIPKSTQCECDLRYMDFPELKIKDKGSINYYTRPTSSLKLDEIYLISNEDLKNLAYSKGAGQSYSQDYSYNWNVTHDNIGPGSQQCDFSSLQSNQHLYQNVFDAYDLASMGGLLQKALRVISLSNSYELVPETENSFDFNLVKVASPSTSDSSYPRFGKLTLNKIAFKGKQGADLIPPLEFKYDYTEPRNGTGYITNESTSATGEYILSISTTSNLKIGDIINCCVQVISATFSFCKNTAFGV